jgi:DNA-binding HxlR family transcriptional regulator
MDMTVIDHAPSDCRATSVLSLVGDKWSVLIVMGLRHGPKRFNELKRTVSGISQQMLARTLKALEREGMLSRTVYPKVPPQVEYALTELGHSLSEPIIALGHWVDRNLAEIENSRLRYDETLERC